MQVILFFYQFISNSLIWAVVVALTPLNHLHKNNQKHVIELHVLPLAALSLNSKKYCSITGYFGCAVTIFKRPRTILLYLVCSFLSSFLIQTKSWMEWRFNQLLKRLKKPDYPTVSHFSVFLYKEQFSTTDESDDEIAHLPPSSGNNNKRQQSVSKYWN